MAVPVSFSTNFKLQLFPEYLGIGILITVIPITTILLIQRYISLFQAKNDFELTFIPTLSLIILAGVTRGFLFFYLIEFTGLDQPTSLPIRILLSTLTTVFWLSIISIAVEDTRSFRNRYQEFMRDSIAQLARDKSHSSEKTLPLYVESELAEIQSILDRTFDDATALSLDKNAMLLAASQVRRTVDENIRPLSHRLWKETVSEIPKIRLGSTIWASIKYLSVPPLASTIFIVLALFLNLLTGYGLIRSIFGTLVTGLIMFIFYSIYQGATQGVFRGSVILNFCALLIPGTLISISLYLSNKLIFDDDTGLFTFIYIFYCFFVALLFSTLNLAKSDRDDLLSMLQASLLPSKNLIFDEHKMMADNLASFLHNSLQSELVALSYQIEDSANNPSSTKAELIRKKIQERASRSVAQDFKNFVEDPRDRLTRIQSAWKGIAKIDLNLPEELLKEEGRNFLLVQIIEEAISNSVRHSKSTQVSVSASQSAQDGIDLEIICDGSFQGPQRPGLGTEWLDRFASGRWSRTINENGSTLFIKL